METASSLGVAGLSRQAIPSRGLRRRHQSAWLQAAARQRCSLSVAAHCGPSALFACLSWNLTPQPRTPLRHSHRRIARSLFSSTYHRRGRHPRAPVPCSTGNSSLRRGLRHRAAPASERRLETMSARPTPDLGTLPLPATETEMRFLRLVNVCAQLGLSANAS